MTRKKTPHAVVHAWIEAQPQEPTAALHEALARLTLGVTLSQFVPPIILVPLGKRVHTILELAVKTVKQCVKEDADYVK